MIGEFGETLLIDWGLSASQDLLEGAPGSAPDVADISSVNSGGKTVQGTAIGTPSYMSPEQAQGDAERVDERSDIWGLGAVLYEVITGRAPYSGGTSAEILRRAASGEIEPVRRVCPDAPSDLAAIADRALSREPEERYGTAQDMAHDLAAYLAGRRVTAHSYTLWELAENLVKRHRHLVTAASLAVAALLVALVFTLVAYRDKAAALRREAASTRHERAARIAAQESRLREKQQRLLASFYLARGYVEKAKDEVRAWRYLSAAVLAAAALQHHPGYKWSPLFDPMFLVRHPEARMVLVRARSLLLQSRVSPCKGLTARRRLPWQALDVKYSPTGTMLAVSGRGSDVLLVDPLLARPFRSLHTGSHTVYALSFSPDGRRLAVGGEGILELWDLSTGGRIWSTKVTKRWVASVAFSPKGRVVAAGGANGRVCLAGADAGRLRFCTRAHSGRVSSLAFSPSGARLLSAGLDRSLQVWDVLPGRLRHSSRVSAGNVYQVSFSPDGARVATGGVDKSVRVWRAGSFRLQHLLLGHDAIVSSVAFSPKGRFLASLDENGILELWDPHSGGTLGALRASDFGSVALAVSPDGSAMASTGVDRELKVWALGLPQGRSRSHRVSPTSTYRPTKAGNPYQPPRVGRLASQSSSSTDCLSLPGLSGDVFSIAYSPDGGVVAVAEQSGEVTLFDPRACRRIATLEAHRGLVRDLAFSTDGRRLATVGQDGRLLLWRMDSGAEAPQVLKAVDLSSGPVYAVAFSSSGLVATGSRDGVVRIMDGGGSRRAVLGGHGKPVVSLDFSPNARLLASASYDGTVVVWDVIRRSVVRTLKGTGGWMFSVDFSGDGSYLAASGLSGRTAVWETSGWECVLTLARHSQPVNVVRFSPDGTRLVTGDDERIIIWSFPAGKELIELSSHGDVLTASYSPNGRVLAVPDAGQILFYPIAKSVQDLQPATMLARASVRAGLTLDGFNLKARPPSIGSHQ